MELAFALLSRAGLDLALCLHTERAVPQAEWSALLERLESSGMARNADPRRARMLVVTDGGAPDARQRSQLGRLRGGNAIRTAVLVPGMNNPIKRGLMTALTWFNPRMAFFLPADLTGALQHLGLERERDPVWATLLSLQSQLPPVRTLKLVAEAAQLPWADAPARALTR